MYESRIFKIKVTRPKINLVPDVVYAQVPTYERPNQLLQMDLIIPQVEQKLPAVIFVTGGAFIASNRVRKLQLRMFLAEKNFVAASINYRTVPNSKFPQPIEDVKSAIRFLKANAEKFNVDAEKIFLIGDSAGGYLVAFAAVTNGSEIFNVGENLHVSSEIAAAVDLYGTSDLMTVASTFSKDVQKLYGSEASATSLFVNGIPGIGGVAGGFSAHPDLAEQANPINYVTKNSAPMLLMHGTADDMVSPVQTDLLFQALRNHGVDAERYLLQDAGHSDEFWYQPEVFELITEFFMRHLN